MHRMKTAAGLMLAFSMSTFMVACGGEEDTQDRAALERESLERELELALQPDTTQQVTLSDLPMPPAEDVSALPITAPAPSAAPQAPRSTTPPVRSTAPRQSAPSPSPAPAPRPAPAPAAPRVVSYPVPAGTTFGVRLNEGLNTRDNPVGSTFSATLTEAILAPNGATLIPAGATVRGRVVESRESARAGQEPHIAIEFTSIAHNGETYAIAGAATNTPVRRATRDSRVEQAAKVGGGAAVGAVLGQIIGRNTRSTVAGGAIGAAVGTAVAIGTAGVDAVVDQGANITVRLNREIRVERAG